ncbi:MAG: DUF6754 domain-containing protein [Anaerolineales bacterium]
MLVALFFLLMMVFAILGRRHPWRNMRPIPAFSRLIRAIGLAVENGTRLHLSLGRSNLTGPRSAAAFVGLTILGRISRIASISDQPPVATVGDGALAILTRDTMRAAYREVGAGDEYNPTVGRLTGVTPFSYAAGTQPVIYDEMVSGSILAGAFGSEAALITGASEHSEGFSMAGTDNVSAQALLYATAQETLIGEELYVGGAYLRAGLMHTASLRAQDVIRWLIVILILGAGLLKLAQGFMS